MRNVAYLQCDVRYNQWLLKKIKERFVVEYTIERVKKIGCQKILAGVYDCVENKQLISILEDQGINVIVSDETNVTKRFLDIVTKEDADYVIRIGGEQIFVNIEQIQKITLEMYELDREFFYDEYAACVLPDIVSVSCLREYYELFDLEERYFRTLEKQDTIKRYKLPYPMLVAFQFRINSHESFRICKNIILNGLDIYDLSVRLMKRIFWGKGYLVQTGLWGSWLLPMENQDFFYDENQEVNPWWGRTVIDFLRPRLNKQMTVFEWGSGNSTLFWSKNVGEVISIEYDKVWYEKMKQEIPSNVEIKYCVLEYGGDYCEAIFNEEKKFDIVLVDERDRVRCAKNAVSRLKEEGIVIVDDSERGFYQEGFDFLMKNGFKRIELRSEGYMSVEIGHTTSIFYKDKNILGL